MTGSGVEGAKARHWFEDEQMTVFDMGSDGARDGGLVERFLAPLQQWLAARGSVRTHRRMAALDPRVLSDIGLDGGALTERRRRGRPMDPVLFTSLAESAAAKAARGRVRQLIAARLDAGSD